MNKLTPFLWFDTNLKAIIDFYLSVFPGSTMTSTGTLSDTPSGTVEMATLTILGQELQLMTAGPLFHFTEAISFVISCKDQAEVDYYWNALTSNGGSEGQCGWLKDTYGLSWQVVPEAFGRMMSTGTKEQIGRVTQSFMQMKKFDIATLEAAFTEH